MRIQERDGIIDGSRSGREGIEFWARRCIGNGYEEDCEPSAQVSSDWGVGIWGGTGEMVSVRTSEWYEPGGRSLGSGEVYKFMICED